MKKEVHLSTSTLFFISGVIVILCAASIGSSTQSISVSRERLCVTEGAVEGVPAGRLTVNVSKMRAYVNALTPQLVEVQFTYLGSTENEARLGSGELRRQFGLKLRAQDACNLVYVMWHIDPESKLVVSTKSNPGQHTSAECGNRGYRNIKPRHSIPVPSLRPGETHTLRAEMNGDYLHVFTDNSPVWEGPLGGDVLAFDGPVGIRSDNARLQLGLRTAEPLQAQRTHAACRANESE